MTNALRQFAASDTSEIWTLLNEIGSWASPRGNTSHLVGKADFSAVSGYYYQAPWQVASSGPKNGMNELGVTFNGGTVVVPTAGRYSIQASQAWLHSFDDGTTAGAGVRLAWLLHNPASIATTNSAQVGGTQLDMASSPGITGASVVLKLHAPAVDLAAGDSLSVVSYHSGGKNLKQYTSVPSVSWMTITRIQ